MQPVLSPSSSPTRWSVGQRALLAAVATVLIWTAFIVVARASAFRTLTAFDIGVCRFVGAGLVMLPYSLWKLRQPGAPKGWLGLSLLNARMTVLCGLFAGAGYSWLAYTGFFFAPAAHASVLMPGMLPLWTAMLAVVLLGDRVSPRRALALALLALGAVLVGGVSIAQAIAAGQGVWKGDVLFLCASFCWSCYSVLLRKHPVDPIAVTAAISVFCLFTAVPLYGLLVALGLVHSQLAAAPWTEIAFQMFMQGGLSVVVSGITFAMMVRHYGPVRSTMITALVPGLSAAGAALLLGEVLGYNVLAGLVCVTLGIVWGVLVQAKPAPAKEGA
jgi:drug/metabolite transporter (DMT)-like permease